MREIYNLFREEDPHRPVIMTHNSISSLRTYLNYADFHSFHCYPPIRRNIRVNDLSRIIGFAEAFLEITAGERFVGFLDQSFNYGDFGRRGHRMHTYQEMRRKMLLALVCGAKGPIFFPSVGFLHYPELHLGIPHLARELDYLGRAIIAPDSELSVRTDSDTARTLLKDIEGELYLFVANADMEPRAITVTVPGISRYSGLLHVVSGDRTVRLREDSFTDTFDTFEVHVYTTSEKTPDLLAVAEIVNKIAEANEARRRPGNLAFQMFEGDGVVLTASSHAAGRAAGRPDNGLWHVVDGIVTTLDRHRLLTWQCTTPNEFPDWLEIKLPQAHTISRVVVYPFQQSLKDYRIQAFLAGEWKEVDKVFGKNAARIEHSFAPVTTDRIRIWVTATHGANSKVTEVEIYEK